MTHAAIKTYQTFYSYLSAFDRPLVYCSPQDDFLISTDGEMARVDVDDVLDWCRDNEIDYFENDWGTYGVCFVIKADSDEDKMIFKLRWA